jgi:tetratricopeptide (TPR) repeat protein
MLDEHLRVGDSRAACVISINPLLVAAYTDELDCVALLVFPAWLVDEHDLKIGDRLLTVNTYSRGQRIVPDLDVGPRQQRRWVNFYPVIAEFVSDDGERIRKRKSEIDEEEWTRCDQMGRESLRRYPNRWRNGSPFWSAQPRPESALAHSNLGKSLLAQGKLEEAIAEFRANIQRKPDCAEAHFNIGVALSKQGKLEEAIAEFRTAIQLKRDFAEAHYSLGAVLHPRGELKEAIAEYRTAIQLKPHHLEAHLNLGSALARLGKTEEAIAAYRTAIRIKPDFADPHTNLGNILAAQGKLAEATAEHREAIRLNPEFALAYNNWAWVLIHSPKRPPRDYDEGLVYARKAVDLAPQKANFATTLALAEYRCGHSVESIAASKRSAMLRNGGSASDWFLLAMAHWQKGDNDEARNWFDKAVVWTKEQVPNNNELRGLWKEAAELLGQPGPDTCDHGPPATLAAGMPQRVTIKLAFANPSASPEADQNVRVTYQRPGD